jgi:hypothetical protein
LTLTEKEHDLMQAQIQRLIGTAMLSVALVSQSLPAWAGAVANAQVTIGYANGGRIAGAAGTLTGARYSADSTQYIGCEVEKHDGYSPYILCAARNLAGTSVSCSSTDPRLVDAVKAITDSSFIEFGVTGNGSGICSDLTVTNGSHNLR